MNHPRPTSRRTALKQMTGAATLALADLSVVSRGAEDIPNPIRVENAKPGTRDWMLSKTGVDPASKYRSPWIEGFCSHRSIRAGETLRFYVSTNPAAKFTIDLYRL